MAALTRARSRRLRCMRGPAQVDVAVAQPDGLVGLGAVVDGERRRLGLVQHLHRAIADLHLARWPMPGFTVPSGRAARCRSTAMTYSLRTSAASSMTHWTMPGVVAQVDEGQVLAVLPAAGHPAAQPHRAAHVRLGPAPRTGGCAWRWAGSRRADRARLAVSSSCRASVSSRWRRLRVVQVPASTSLSGPSARPRGEEALQLVHTRSPGTVRCSLVAAQRAQAVPCPRPAPGARPPGPPGPPSGPPT